MLAESIVAVVFAAGAVALAFALVRLRTTERRYRVLLEHLPQTSVVLFDHELRLQLLVGGALRENNVQAWQVQGKRLQEVVPGEQGDILARHYKAALRGENRSLEYTSAMDDRSYWLRVVPVREGGKITGGMAVSQDITSRKRAEREREIAEGTRRMMVDAMNEADVAIDANGVVTDWNDRATQLFGYRRTEAIGRPTIELIIPPEDHGDFRRLIQNHVRSAGEGDASPLDLRTERTAIHRDGHRFPVELAAATLTYEGVTSLHTFMHDITDRKQSQAEADAHAADVEAMADATAALARSTGPAEAREAICRAAMTIAGATAALMFEPEPSGRGLVATAAINVEVADTVLPFVGQTSGAVRAFGSSRPIFSPDLARDGSLQRDYIRKGRARSAYWLPVQRGDATLGVVAVGWQQQLDKLPERVNRVMGLVAAEAAVAIERAGLLDRLERMARTDDLTGLPNRRAWDQEIAREIARARRESAPLTVAMVDLDFFKAFNDAHGHQAGDRLLKEAAGSWRAVLRETDVLARYGGEEFTIALPGCAEDEATRLVERLRAVTPSGESCSAGIASWDGHESADALVGRADRALYEAKQSGRNRTVSA